MNNHLIRLAILNIIDAIRIITPIAETKSAESRLQNAINLLKHADSDWSDVLSELEYFKSEASHILPYLPDDFDPADDDQHQTNANVDQERFYRQLQELEVLIKALKDTK